MAGFGRIAVEDDRDCECISKVALNAKATLVKAGLASEEQTYEDVTVWLRASSSRFEMNDGEHAWGRYVPLGETRGALDLERFGRSFAHELFHHLDLTRDGATVWETAKHEGWEERGVFDAVKPAWWYADNLHCR
ncbi:MAG: hypothetical protein ABW123_22830 [Cystobacter sp.]